LGVLPVTDVIQTLFLEAKTVRDIEVIQTLFPELKAIQVNELMSLRRRFPDVHTQLPAAILDDDKKEAVICFCVIFLDPVNQRPPPSHRPEFDPASFGKGANGKDIKRERLAKRMSEKKDDTVITKTETWAKASQKRRMTPLSPKLKRGQKHLRK
jgi:hypothetical protein